MAYVSLTIPGAINVPCAFQGEVSIPLFTPPYTIAEFNQGSSDGWLFSQASKDIGQIVDTVTATMGIYNVLTSFSAIIINPFTYFRTQYKPRINPAYATQSRRFANTLNLFVNQGSNRGFRSYNIASPAALNILYNTLQSVRNPNILASVLFSAGQSGYCLVSNLLSILQPFFDTTQGVGACNWIGTDYINLSLDYEIRAMRFTPNTNLSLFPSLFGFEGPQSYNYTPINIRWGDAVADRSIKICKWDWDCFNNGKAFILKPIFDDPLITSAFNDFAENTMITVPAGFIAMSGFNYYSTQHGTYILVSKDAKKYWRLKFIPQSAGANTAINQATVGKFWIDIFGVAYFAQANGLPRGVIYNSQGFNFPFQFNVDKIPYANLPCWPPCYGVPLMKSNLL